MMVEVEADVEMIEGWVSICVSVCSSLGQDHLAANFLKGLV